MGVGYKLSRNGVSIGEGWGGIDMGWEWDRNEVEKRWNWDSGRSEVTME